ncbi:MAG: PF20097 family protein [Erysipelotrichaceae bacterium]|uniref:PF20097 family protein n=1 Tax=Anaerorhabdus sp. TaxID=1872524 RepID=UPI002FCA4E35
MNCPYCNTEMEKGYMQGASRMMWTPKPHSFIMALPKKDEIMFDSGITKASLCTAYLCRHCKKIVMDYDDAVVNK